MTSPDNIIYKSKYSIPIFWLSFSGAIILWSVSVDIQSDPNIQEDIPFVLALALVIFLVCAFYTEKQFTLTDSDLIISYPILPTRPDTRIPRNTIEKIVFKRYSGRAYYESLEIYQKNRPTPLKFRYGFFRNSVTGFAAILKNEGFTVEVRNNIFSKRTA